MSHAWHQSQAWPKVWHQAREITGTYNEFLCHFFQILNCLQVKLAILRNEEAERQFQWLAWRPPLAAGLGHHTGS